MKAAEPHGTRRAGWISARLDRVRLDRVPVATRPWIVACWVLTLAIAVLLLVPGLADDVTVDPVGAAHILDRFLAPAWLRMLLVVACGGVAAVAAVLALLRRSADLVGSSRLRREAALALVAFPPLALVADRILIPAVAAGLLGIVAEVLAHSGRPTRARAAWVGVIAFLPWAVLAATQPFVATDGWTWAVLFGLAAGFAAFGSYYGVQRAAESRTAAVAFLFRTRIPPIGVLGIVAAVVALVVLRLTVLREAFPEPDPTLWSPFAKESPLSWVHAALVALLIVLVGWRSTRRPLRRFGERRIAAALAAVGNVELVLGSVVIVGTFLVAVVVGAADLPDAWLAWVPALKVGGVVVIGLSALLPWMRCSPPHSCWRWWGWRGRRCRGRSCCGSRSCRSSRCMPAGCSPWRGRISGAGFWCSASSPRSCCSCPPRMPTRRGGGSAFSPHPGRSCWRSRWRLSPSRASTRTARSSCSVFSGSR
jgi:hypothetical protein